MADALNHPTWRMGDKITVDSATLANKALEVIEAHFLFGLPYERIEVVVHPQSVVHSMVEFVRRQRPGADRIPDDGAADALRADAPGARSRRRHPAASIRWRAGPLTFEPVRTDVFRAFSAGVAAGRAGGTAPAVFNAANEVAVAAFLAGTITFGRIAEVIEQVLATACGWPRR